MKYCLTMSYDGSQFSGFQRQADEQLMTVQGKLESTLTELFGESITIHGAGRTDAGVHARAQTAHFSMEPNVPPERLKYALNRALPPFLVISDVKEAEEDFHARKSAIGKWYSYRIYHGQTPPALGHQYFTHIPTLIDETLFRQALDKYVGFHQFEGFCGRGATVKNYDRTIHFSRLIIDEKDSAWWQVHFIGDGFLRKMVRNLVGTALDIGMGRRPLSCIDDALTTHDRTKAGRTAAADGLMMEEVFYSQMLLQQRIQELQMMDAHCAPYL